MTPSDDRTLSDPRPAAVPEKRDLEWWGRRLRAAGIVLAALWAIHSVTQPLTWDQGIFAWIGGEIVNGKLPYRDAWDIKGPLTFYTVALAELLFGRHEWALRAMDLVWLAVGVASVAALVRRLEPERSAPWWGALLYVFWFASLGHADTTQPDGWAAVLLTVAALAMVRGGEGEGRGVRGAAIAGLCIGACALFKPTYGVFLLMPFVHLVATTRRERRWRTLVTALAAAGLAFALPLALCVAWFAYRGGLGALYEVSILYPLRAYAELGTGWLWRVREVAAWLLTRQFAAPLALALVGARVLMVANRPAAGLVLAWCAAALLNVIVQGQFYPYHWIPLYPPLAVLTAVGIGALVRSLSPSPGGGLPPRVARDLLAASVAVVACSAALVPTLTLYRWSKSLLGATPRERYEADEYGKTGRQGASMYAVAQYVRSRTAPGDVVLLWGRHPGYNFLIDRPVPGRFGFLPPALERPTNPFAERYREEIVASVIAARPTYIVVMAPDACRRTMPLPTTCISAWPPLAEFLGREYHLERTMPVVDDAGIYPYAVMRRNR